MKTHADAATRGAQLLGKMRGSGWELRVWENFGWHFAVGNGVVSVREHSRPPGGYSCMVAGSHDMPGSGSGFWTTKGTRFVDPNEAVRNEVEAARAVVDRLDALVQQAERVFDD